MATAERDCLPSPTAIPVDTLAGIAPRARDAHETTTTGPRSTHAAIRGRHWRPAPAALSGPRQSAPSPIPGGSTDLATATRQKSNATARGDDEPQGESVRAQGSTLLPVPKLAGTR